MKLDAYLTPHVKINLLGIKNLIIKAKIVKPLEKKWRIFLQSLDGRGTQKALTMKEKNGEI